MLARYLAGLLVSDRRAAVRFWDAPERDRTFGPNGRSARTHQLRRSSEFRFGKTEGKGTTSVVPSQRKRL